jgi:hypothetical protein
MSNIRSQTTFQKGSRNSDVSSFDDIYKYLFEKVGDYAPGKEALVCLELADGVYQSSMVFEKQIVFVATLQKIINALK